MSAEAIVFVPGIGRDPFGQASMSEGLASRLVAALDRNSDEGWRFAVETQNQDLGQPFGRTDFSRISISRAGIEPEVVTDVYALDLPALLIEPYRNLGTKGRAVRLGWLLFLLFPRLVGVWRKREKRLLEQVEVLAGAGVFLALLLVFLGMLAILLAGLVGTFASLGPFEFARDSLLAPAALITFVLANLSPTWRAELNASLVVALVAGNYVTSGARKDRATGRLGDLIDKLADDGGYGRIHLIAYSIGSLIALDALFSTTTPIRSMENVDSLITIGCPADFIQTYWPEYFHDRLKTSAPRWWTNVFEPTDLLASNFISGDNYAQSFDEVARKNGVSAAGIRFRDDTGERLPDVNLRYAIHATRRQQGYLVTSMKLHRIYWSPTDPGAAGVFDSIVQALTRSDLSPVAQDSLQPT